MLFITIFAECENLKPEIVGGFTISWHAKIAKGSNTTKDKDKELIWKGKYDPVENNRNVLTLMTMVRESKKNNIAEKDVWKSLLKNRWSSEIIKDSPCLNEDQEYSVIQKTAEELNLDRGDNTWAPMGVPDEDLAFGKELFSIMKCPFHVTEAGKLSHFFRHLLTHHTLNTVVASTMRNIQPLAGDNIKDFTEINIWYERLDKRYNLSLGPVILPLMTSEHLTQLDKLDPPYLKDFKANRDGHQHHNISTVFGKVCSYRLILLHRF